MDPLNTLVWIFIVIIALTALITFMGLLGIVKLGGGDVSSHHIYLNKLIKTIIIESAIAGIGAFTVYLANQNKQIIGLEKLLDISTDNSSLLQDTVSIPAEYFQPISDIQESLEDTILNDENYLGNSENDLETEFALITLESPVAYATTDQPKSDIEIIPIPNGFKYVGHETIITTKNGDAHENVDLIEENERVVAVKLHVFVGERSLFGPRHWIGAVLKVFIEPEV